jgi:hypothetical protein
MQEVVLNPEISFVHRMKVCTQEKDSTTFVHRLKVLYAGVKIFVWV